MLALSLPLHSGCVSTGREGERGERETGRERERGRGEREGEGGGSEGDKRLYTSLSLDSPC